MARANFKYEKRMKELAKQKKAEEKRQKRLERRQGTDPSPDEPIEDMNPSPDESVEGGDEA